MPTPFMHMIVAHELLGDPALDPAIRTRLSGQLSAFMLGNIAADARVSSGVKRADTHFFDYTPIIDPPPGDLMLSRHPDLRADSITDPAHQAFIAGYLAHLQMDMIWAVDMLYAGFGAEWGTQEERFHMLHVVLAYLDRRDYQRLDPTDGDTLRAAMPGRWLPFIPDRDLIEWRDLIASQFDPATGSLTLDIFTKRIGWTVAEMDALLHDANQLEQRLFTYVPLSMIEAVESKMYDGARNAIRRYFLPDPDV